MSLSTTMVDFSFNSQTRLKPLAPTPPIGCMMMISIWIWMRMTLHFKEGMPMEERELPDVRGLLHPRRCLNPPRLRAVVPHALWALMKPISTNI